MFPPRPTTRRVIGAYNRCLQNDATRLTEKALGLLWKQYPNNKKPPEVHLKIASLNQLYGTQIRADHLATLTLHMVRKGIDRHLAAGSSEAVETIANCPEINTNYSFATKFCSWQKPKIYPIWDRRVDRCLWRYQAAYPFAHFKRHELRNYYRFRAVIASFQEHFGLTDVSLKQLDKFLWLHGAP